MISNIETDFWTSFTRESDWPSARVYENSAFDEFCTYLPVPADELEKDKAKTDEDNAIKARGRELNRQAREFEAIAKANRTTWLKHNLRALTHEHAETESAGSRSLTRSAGGACSRTSPTRARTSSGS